MPTASFRVSTHLRSAPAAVFAYVSDLTRHGEWAANELRIEPQSAQPVTVGSAYRSQAQVNDLLFTAHLRVITHQPPTHFAFEGEDSTGKFRHDFVLEARDGGTRLERRVSFELDWRQWIFYWLMLYPVRLPAARRALSQLKHKLEAPNAKP